MAKRKNSSFVRWQGRTIQQFGYVNNLLLGLATGLLAFEIQFALAESNTVVIPNAQRFIALSLLLVFLSLMVGSWLALNRLSAFRTTTEVARKRETDDRKNIENLRERYRTLDNRSWQLLWAQIALFVAGALVLVGTALTGYFRNGIFVRGTGRW